MESAFVIKVNYRGTLRRFSAVVENGQLDLDMNGLKAKILSLFEIPSDANLTITYVDEDGDVVTLIEDEDLYDIMRQNLKFLRITVVLNNEKSGKSYAASSASSTPLKSPRVRQPFSNVSVVIAEALRSVPDPLPAVNAAVAEALRSVPGPLPAVNATVAEALRSVPDPLPAVNAAVAEALRSVPDPLPAINAAVAEALRSVPNPLHDSLLKLYTDFVSKAASSSPALSDFINMFTNMAESYTMEKQPPADGETASQLGISAGSTDLKQEASTDSKATKDDTLGDALPKLDFGYSCCEKGKEIDVGDVSAASSSPVKIPVDLNANTAGKSSFAKESYKAQLLKDVNVQANKTEQLPQPSESQGSNNTSQKAAVETQVVGLSASACNSIYGRSSLNRSVPAPGMPMSSPPFGVGGLSGDCPFSGMSLPNKGGIFHGVPHHANSYGHFGTVFHKGVRCDGCGLHPITGPRFKSKVKEDFDLCSFCFASTMAKAEDYNRLDRPVPYGAFGHGRPPVRGLNDQYPLTLPQVFKGRRAAKPKLDSRFVSDVTVMDGSVMAPSTPFTKIWRMRNNGVFSWHRGTQLVWIGGDKFCDTIALELEIPAAGVPMDGELDIAIDFKSPNLPGRYISYWRMASPSGQKFGQRVWVLIQVDASLGDSVRTMLEDLNLNLPPQMPVDDFFGETGNDRLNLVNIVDFSGVAEEVQIPAASMPETDEHKRKEAEMNFPINSTLLTGENESRPAAASSPSISYPKIETSETPAFPVALSAGASSPSLSYPKIETSEAPAFPVALSAAVPVAVPIASAPSEFAMENTGPDVEATLLKELEEMGFKQVDLNKEILRMNAYDMEQSIEALCGITEWDPMLEELQEMGFCDTEKNRILLKKNNGSIKRVVRDLLTGERA